VIRDRPARLAIVLHGHLPFVRHPEYPRFYEETWLFEAVLECYLPLIEQMRQWQAEGLSWRLTLTLSPTLCAMLTDPILKQRCGRWLEEREQLAIAEVQRGLFNPSLRALARFYQERFARLRSLWQTMDGDLIGQWALFQNSGALEILTCTATHGLLPLLASSPGAMRGQLATAVREYHRHFGRNPAGIWLPECAYTPAIEPALVEAGLRWFVLETHGVLQGHPPPPEGIFAPIQTRHGLVVFPRDPASARQVWSRHGGYPGDPRYREFHQDLSQEAEWHYLTPFLPGTPERVLSGIKYHRVTGGTGPKGFYDPELATQAALEHGHHFVEERSRHLHAASDCMNAPPLLVAPYDAELFGHWWFEGPQFLDAVIRRVARAKDGFTLVTLAEAAAQSWNPPVSEPLSSTWGEGGHLGVWLDPENAWIQDELRRVEQRWASVLARVKNGGACVQSRIPELNDSMHKRLLAQAAREMLLAQASDWPFLIKMGTAKDYAAERVRTHLEQFHRLLDMEAGMVPFVEADLIKVESQDNLFPEIHISDWRS